MPLGLVRQTAKGLVAPLLPGAPGADLTALVRTLDAYTLEQWAWNQPGSQALSYGYKGGTIFSGAAYSRIADGTVPLAENATNYVERDTAGVVTSNTVGFSATKTPMAAVVTSGGAIQSVQDNRPLAAGAGGGGGGIGGSGTAGALAVFSAPTAIAGSLVPGAAGGYVRSNGTAWLRVSGVPASDVTGILALAHGGTGADLSATGGTSYVLRQSSAGAVVTVSQLGVADIANGAALTKTDDTNVTLTLGGTPASALLAATSLTLGWSGQLALSRGGTGADLSATGAGYLKQATTGARVTVANIAITDLVANAAGWLHNDGAGTVSWSTPDYSDVGADPAGAAAAVTLAGLGGEPALGNPAVDGEALVSSVAGARSWGAFVPVSGVPALYTLAVIAAPFTIPSGHNALSVGPVTIADGVTVVIPDTSTWSVV